MIFAISLLPIFGAVGAAVDYSRLERTRVRMQLAADNAVLTAAIEDGLPKQKRTRVAKKTYRVSVPEHKPKTFKMKYVDDTITLNVSTDLGMTFLGIFGYEYIPVKVMAQAKQGQTDVEVALVLDISGSMLRTMSSGKTRIEELKIAAGNLIDEVDNAGAGRSKYSIVPFTMNVNVGAKNTSFVSNSNDPLFANSNWKGCVQERSSPLHIANQPGAKLNAYIWPPSPNSTADGFCENPSNGTNSAYASLQEIDPVLAANPSTTLLSGPNRNCVRHEILPLTKNARKAKKHLDSLVSVFNEGTIIAPGVTWGLRVLSPEWPFTGGNNWSNDTRKYMVVLTDGEQTTEVEFSAQTCSSAKNTIDNYFYSPGNDQLGGKTLTSYGPIDNWTPYGFITDSDPFGSGIRSTNELPETLETLSLAACNEAKRSYNGTNIKIYTIGISRATAPGTRAFDLLSNCATSPADHYYVQDAESLQAAFSAIAKDVKQIRLSQ